MCVLSSQVLLFEDEVRRSAFLGLLRSELGKREQHVSVRSVREKELLREAVTRTQRAQIVEVFFRHAFAKVTHTHTHTHTNTHTCTNTH